MSSRYLNIVIPVILYLVIAYFIKDIPYYDFDNWCWAIWSSHDLKEGLGNAYNDPQSPLRTNYLPVFHYVLYLFGLICGSEQSIHANIAYLKLFTLAFDWLGLWYIYKWIDKKIAFYWLVIISAFNVSYAYNTVIWGQVDGIAATFALISAYYGFHRKTAISAIFIVLAVNMKLQAIIFFPIWGFFYVQRALEERTLKSFLLPLASLIVAQVVLLLPFLDSLDRIREVSFESVGSFPYVSVMAFNYWHIALGEGVWNLLDTGRYIGGVTYKQFGLAVFFLFSFLAMLPMLAALYTRLARSAKKITLTKDQVLIICALVALGFFFFNTQMHERYSHPAFIFIAAYSFYKKDLIPYILFSVAYFLNLDKVSVLLKLNNYHTAIFDHVFISCVYAAVLIYLFVRLWLSFRQKI